MTNTPQSSPSSAASSFPRQLAFPLALVIEVSSQEELDYFVQAGSEAALGFIADLFDHLNFEMAHSVKSINGHTPEEVRRHFQQFLP